MATINADMAALALTVGSHTSTLTNQTTRLDLAEADVTSLKAWRANKGAALANLTTPTTSGLTIVGLGIPVDKTSIDAAFGTFTTRLNAITTTLKAREIIN